MADFILLAERKAIPGPVLIKQEDHELYWNQYPVRGWVRSRIAATLYKRAKELPSWVGVFFEGSERMYALLKVWDQEKKCWDYRGPDANAILVPWK